MNIYRKLLNIGRNEVSSIWEYDPDINKERMIWARHGTSKKPSSWSEYEKPAGCYQEIEITKEEAEAFLFLEKI